MKIIMTGGGTGGHIYPAISLARELQKRDSKHEIFFVGTNHGMESEIIPREGFLFYAIKVRGIQRKICLESLYAILLFLLSLSTSFKLIRRIRPDLVIGTGGYVSGSIVLMSSVMGIPTFIHEQNAIPGITNRWLSLTSRLVFVSFPESKKYFRKSIKVVCLGNPVRENIRQGNKEVLIRKSRLSVNKKTILVFGGSKGANVINQTFLDCLTWIDEPTWQQWQILMISGKEDYVAVKERIERSKFRAEIHLLSYLYQMGDAYDLANLAICRAGATTIAEFTAKGLPAVLIPYPYATGDHQLINARFLASSDAAVVIPQDELSDKKMAWELSQLLNNPEKLKVLARNSRNMGNQKAAEEIIDAIFDYM